MLGALGDVAEQATGSTPDWSKLLGIPAAVVAVITLLAFAIGFIRPVAIKQARYWTSGVGDQHITELSCRVKNRKINIDRTLTNLALLHIPPLGYRIRHWRWRQDYTDTSPYILKGAIFATIRKEGGVKVAKRDEWPVRCRILSPHGRPLGPAEELPQDVRLMAYFGSSRPAVKRLRGDHRG
jgi:hypothetical protein